VLGFGLSLPRIWCRCRVGAEQVQWRILYRYKTTRKFNVLFKGYKRSMISQVRSGKLGSEGVCKLQCTLLRKYIFVHFFTKIFIFWFKLLVLH
jgi:hypothetical protein